MKYAGTYLRLMTARNHHFVSQCYLRGFTHGRQRQSQLKVIDRERRNHFSTPARNVGAERDFNRVEIEGLAPDALETAYSGFEGLLAPALERIERARNLENEEDRIILLNFIALLAVRNPRFRGKMQAAQEHTMRIAASMMVHSKEHYEAQIKQAKASGHIDDGEIASYEEMKRFIDNGEYDIAIPRENHIGREIDLHQTVLECLIGREWIVIATQDAAGFVTTDHPVCLRWIDPPAKPSIYGPGFGVAGTEVLFPISKNLLAVGRFAAKADNIEADAPMTAHLNSMVASYASTQVYAADDNALFMTHEGDVLRGIELLDQPFFQRLKKS